MEQLGLGSMSLYSARHREISIVDGIHRRIYDTRRIQEALIACNIVDSNELRISITEPFKDIHFLPVPFSSPSVVPSVVPSCPSSPQ